MILSDLQRKILEKLKQSAELGESLSLRDLGKMFYLAANTILYHIKQLEKKGFIVRDVNGKVIRINSPNSSYAIAYLPLLGAAKCGPPLEYVVENNLVQMIPVPLRLLGRNTKRNLYLVKAIGDSMKPKIEEGDLVIFEPRKPMIGEMVVARISDGFTIKIFKETNSQFILEPYNPEYELLVFDKNEIGEAFNIDGVAVGTFKPEFNLKNGGE